MNKINYKDLFTNVEIFYQDSTKTNRRLAIYVAHTSFFKEKSWWAPVKVYGENPRATEPGRLMSLSTAYIIVGDTYIVCI